MSVLKQTSFKPPQSVQRAARRGLELRRRFGRGGLSTGQASRQGIGSGVQRATNLANGNSVSLATVRRMRAFFERHERNNRPSERESDGGPTAGRIAWLLWGGDAGRTWANGILRRQDDRDATKSDNRQMTKSFDVKVAKTDDRLGIVFGYAIVCKQDDEDYYDVQGDHITEKAMLEAAADFMGGDRKALIQHRGEQAGRVIFAFPMTGEIAKAHDIAVKQTGLLIGMQPDDPDVLKAFEEGALTGFSIGGSRVDEEVVEDDA